MDPNEKLTGIQQLPMGGGQPPMGGPPMPPMGGPPMPPMGGGQPPMGGGQPPMDPGMGEMAMEGQPSMEEPQANPEEDAGMLAEAVVGRAGGDINGAIAMLDTAKAMLMSAAQGGQEPQMAMNGGPMYANMGGPLDYNMGGPLYREDGGTMSDTDMLREMIMDSILSNQQKGRSISEKDINLHNSMLINPSKPSLGVAFKEEGTDDFKIGGSTSDRDSMLERIMGFKAS